MATFLMIVGGVVVAWLLLVAGLIGVLLLLGRRTLPTLDGRHDELPYNVPSVAELEELFALPSADPKRGRR